MAKAVRSYIKGDLDMNVRLSKLEEEGNIFKLGSICRDSMKNKMSSNMVDEYDQRTPLDEVRW